MPKHRLLRDAELMKLLIDPRRSRILEITEKEPLTVNQIAEKLDEVPSRVYYHVHKLEEAGLLELVETRMHGNLVEKLYQCKEQELQFSIDPSLIKTHSSAVLKQIHQTLDTGMKLLEYKMHRRDQGTAESGELPPPEPKVRVSMSWNTMTERDWKAQHLRSSSIGESSVTDIEDESSEEETFMQKQASEAESETGRYTFIVLSYRQEDAERLGFTAPRSITLGEDEEGESQT